MTPGLGTRIGPYEILAPHAKLGDTDRARAIRDEMEARSRHEFMSSFWSSVASASAGLLDKAIERVGRAVAERDPLVVWGRVTPFWDVIRTHPGFEAAVRGVRG